MRHLGLLLVFVFLGGLLFTSQALAAEQPSQEETLQVAALSGEQLRQWHVAQMHPQDSQMHPQDSQMQVRRLSVEQVREMQALLNHRGYYVSNCECDGIGDETMAAIESFQKDQGLTVTGLPNEETLKALVLSTPQHEFFGIAPEFGGDEE
ncbi:MAG: hypothetical protein C0619_15385 [Desulfuromonas sp.]|nr:MAG: hypothetical protein C0619_15385 [Desulfuromonas sp.]